MYLAIVGLPGISYLVGAIMGRKCGRKGVSLISSTCIWLAGILAIVGEVEVVLRESPVSVKLMRWVGLEKMDVEWGLLFDGVSMTMTVVVLTISAIVHMYSNWYMEGDTHKIRYLSYLSLFTSMMIIMVTADNYILMFVGWEGILGCLKWSKRQMSSTRVLKRESAKNKRDDKLGHREEILSIITGSLLGESHLEKRKGGVGTRLILEQCGKNVEYLMWFHKKLSSEGYCSERKPKLKIRIRKGGTYYSYTVKSYTFESFNKLYEKFYKLRKGVRKKVVPRDIDLNPLVLAIWFMEDGSRIKDTVRIATNKFEKEEVEYLCEILKERYGIKASGQKGGKGKGYIIYIYKGSKERFEGLIRGKMEKSMYYKLGGIRS